MVDFKEDCFEYDFKALNPTDYECVITCEVSGFWMDIVFNQVKNKLSEMGKNTDKKPEDIDAFDVPQAELKRWNHLIKTNLRKEFASIRKEVKIDKIEILSNEIVKMSYKRGNDNNWYVTIIFAGNYVDKR